MKTVLAVLLVALAGAPATAQPDPAIDAAVLAVYDVLSFDGGDAPDAAAVLAHFTPDARLAFVRDSLTSLAAADYFARWAEGVTRLESLHEEELGGRTEQFGDVAHRMSAYAVRVNGAQVERGVILFQLVRDGDRWLVHAMAWDSEDEALALPADLSSE